MVLQEVCARDIRTSLLEIDKRSIQAVPICAQREPEYKLHLP